MNSRDEFFKIRRLEVFKYFTIIASEDYYFLRFSKPEMSLTHTTSRSDLTVLTYGFIHFVIKRPFEILRNGHVETQILKYIKAILIYIVFSLSVGRLRSIRKY